MSSPSDNVAAPAALITVPAEAFARFLHLRTLASAAEAEAKAAKVALGIPEAADLAASLGMSEGATLPGVVVVVDGNSRPVGKVAVSWRKGYAVAPMFTAKIS